MHSFSNCSVELLNFTARVSQNHTAGPCKSDFLSRCCTFLWLCSTMKSDGRKTQTKLTMSKNRIVTIVMQSCVDGEWDINFFPTRQEDCVSESNCAGCSTNSPPTLESELWKVLALSTCEFEDLNDCSSASCLVDAWQGHLSRLCCKCLAK